MGNNISSIKDCYGCGVCAAACRKQLIRMVLNSDGFLTPRIDNTIECTSCGLCSSVCSFINESDSYAPIRCYAAWSKDEKVRMASASGGVSYEISKKLIRAGYKFCGVRYNAEKNQAEHYIAEDIGGLKDSLGSKYIQSYTIDAFRKLNRKDNYIVVGTPCQIASLRRLIKRNKCEENYILVDFFCHGVPSKLMWNKYLSQYSKKIGRIKFVSWRNKLKGWRKSYCISFEAENGKYQCWSDKDDFFAMFLGDACLGKACYDSCKFKYSKSFADIRVGDFWGPIYKEEVKGVSSVVVFTQRGLSVLCDADLHLIPHTLQEVAGHQMINNANRKWYYRLAFYILRSRVYGLNYFAKVIRLNNRIDSLMNKLSNKI